jgi:hypothetical protein
LYTQKENPYYNSTKIPLALPYGKLHYVSFSISRVIIHRINCCNEEKNKKAAKLLFWRAGFNRATANMPIPSKTN